MPGLADGLELIHQVLASQGLIGVVSDAEVGATRQHQVVRQRGMGRGMIVGGQAIAADQIIEIGRRVIAHDRIVFAVLHHDPIDVAKGG